MRLFFPSVLGGSCEKICVGEMKVCAGDGLLVRLDHEERGTRLRMMGYHLWENHTQKKQSTQLASHTD